MVIWLIGLSAAGKTTIGKEVFIQLKEKTSNTVFVDGDAIRAIFKHDIGDSPYTIEGRRKNADRIKEICRWLDKQDINVVCSILSIFEETRKWNRENYSNYFEVYVSVPMDILRKRDKKNLYEPAINGKTKNVVGLDITFEEPECPDLVIDNSKEGLDIKRVASDILSKAFEKHGEGRCS